MNYKVEPGTCPTCGGPIETRIRSTKIDLMKRLTVREQEVVRLKAYEGLTNKEVAYRLFLSEQTIKNHVTNILRKTQTNNMVHLAGKLPPKSTD